MQEIMPTSYSDDIRRIHRNLNTEVAGVRKPNANMLLALARSAAYALWDFDQVARCDAQAARRRQMKRVARQRKKGRRAAASAYSAAMKEHDPCSNNEEVVNKGWSRLWYW